MYREVSADRNTATETQTLFLHPAGDAQLRVTPPIQLKPAGNSRKANKQRENPQKLRDLAPTYRASCISALTVHRRAAWIVRSCHLNVTAAAES